MSVGQILAGRWELVGKHKSREQCRRDCVTRATVAEAIDVEHATGYPTDVPTKAISFSSKGTYLGLKPSSESYVYYLEDMTKESR